MDHKQFQEEVHKALTTPDHTFTEEAFKFFDDNIDNALKMAQDYGYHNDTQDYHAWGYLFHGDIYRHGEVIRYESGFAEQHNDYLDELENQGS